jgi:hypothetical protein
MSAKFAFGAKKRVFCNEKMRLSFLEPLVNPPYFSVPPTGYASCGSERTAHVHTLVANEANQPDYRAKKGRTGAMPESKQRAP